MKNTSIFLLVISLLFMAACSSNEASSEKTAAKEANKETDKTVDISAIQEVSTEGSLSALKKQQGGTKTSDISIEADTAESDGEAEVEDSIQAAIPALKETIKEDDSPETVHKALIAALGSPHYEQTIQEAEELVPAFEDPYLPKPEAEKSANASSSEIENSIILLDASSSMLLDVDGEQKMNVAKDAVKSFAKSLGSTSDISLIVYGHKGSESDADMTESCSGIEEVYASGAYDNKKFSEATDQIEAKGWTPLAGAIESAAKKSSSMNGATAIYIVSDGKETCGGDPVKAAEQAASDESGVVNVIGFDVDEESENQLADVAEAGNGNYYSADSAEDLQTTIEYEWLPSDIDLAWAPVNIPPNPWEVLDEYERQREVLGKVENIMANEEYRYEAALIALNEENVISKETSDNVKQLAEDRFDAAEEELSSLEQSKIDAVNERKEDIRNEVLAWVEEMKGLKEESS
ncbi:VWA domain-containing protein [Terribacillus saccharophilus]|uniref:vWA domain-containing protein n=1 Tax=Terribacillus saccharophilus TaxID=361277 RepID=UPI003981FF2C